MMDNRISNNGNNDSKRKFIKADYNNKVINQYKRSTDPDMIEYKKTRWEIEDKFWRIFYWIVCFMVLISGLIWID